MKEQLERWIKLLSQSGSNTKAQVKQEMMIYYENEYKQEEHKPLDGQTTIDDMLEE